MVDDAETGIRGSFQPFLKCLLKQVLGNLWRVGKPNARLVGYQAAWQKASTNGRGAHIQRCSQECIWGTVERISCLLLVQVIGSRMTFLNKLSKAVKLWREQCYLEVLSLFSEYVPGRVFLFKRYYVLRVRRGRISVRQREGVLIRLGATADIERLVMLVGKREDHLEAFRKSHFCVVAEAADKIIGYEYCHAGPSHYEESLGYRFDLGPQSVLCYDAYVHPDYRNKGVWREIQTGIINLLGDSRGFYALVSFTNHISLKAHLRYGFEIVRQFTEIDLLGLRFIFEKPFSRGGLAKVNHKLSLRSKRGVVA